MKNGVIVGLACLVLGACNQPQQADQQQDAGPQAGQPVAAAAAAPDASAPVSALHAHADWQGKWIGVEGMYIEIIPTSPGTYDITMQYDLENEARVTGTDKDGVIAFERNGEALSLRPAIGDEIGLKWLDGQQNCLMVQDGEGYCR